MTTAASTRPLAWASEGSRLGSERMSPRTFGSVTAGAEVGSGLADSEVAGEAPDSGESRSHTKYATTTASTAMTATSTMTRGEPEGARPGAQHGPPAVVLEAGEGLGEAVDEGHGDELADRAVPLRVGRDVEDAHPLHALIARVPVPHAQDLQGGADRQELAPVLERAGQPGVGAELLRSQGLRRVLSTAQCVDVERAGDGVREADRDDRGVDAPPAGAFAQDHGIARVPVGAEHLGHEDADRQCGNAHRFAPFSPRTVLKSRIAV